MMSHIVESCPQNRLHGGLSKLHSADDDAVAWLTSYGSFFFSIVLMFPLGLCLSPYSVLASMSHVWSSLTFVF